MISIQVFATLVLLFGYSNNEQSPASIWSRLGWKNIALLRANTNESKAFNKAFQSLKDCSRLSIGFVSLTLSQFWKMNRAERYQLCVVIEDNFEIIPLLKEQGAYRFMVMPSKSHNLERFVRYMRDLELDVGLLYLTWNNLNEAQLFRIHSFRHRIDPVMNLWTPMENLNLFHESYTMNGNLFHSVELEYRPSFEFVNCSIGDLFCQGQGKSWETHLSAAQVMNFTLLSAWSAENTWGTVPCNIGQDSNLSISELSVLGQIQSQRFDGSINDWVLDPLRTNCLDNAISGVQFTQLLIISPISKPMDSTFYLRSFSSSSLYALVCTTILLLVLLRLCFKLVRISNSIGLRILVISSWLFFMLVQAHYGGALTMFLTTDIPSVPFHSLLQGLQLFPEWQILVGPDNAFYIEQYIKDPSVRPFNEYQARYKDSIVLGSTQEVLAQLGHGKYFTVGSTSYMAEQYNRLKSTSHPDLKLHAIEYSKYFTTNMLQKHSPWKRVIDRGMLRVWANGLMETIHEKWDSSMPTTKPMDRLVISLNHFGPVLLCYLGILFLCTLILLGELAHVKFRQKGTALAKFSS